MRLALFALLCARAAWADVTPPPPAGPAEIAVGTSSFAVEQDGRALPIVKGVVRLKRAPFTIRLTMPIGEGMLIQAAEDGAHYRHVRAGRPVAEDVPVDGTGMAENPFNKDHSIALAPDAYNYWYWQSSADGRFDRVYREGRKVVARRTVERLEWVGEGKKTRAVADAPATLYLVLAKTQWDERASQSRVLGQAAVALEFSPGGG